MRTTALVVLLLSMYGAAADKPELMLRRQNAVAMIRDGILLIHGTSELSMTADGFRQAPFFYYLTGLADTPGALLALDGRSGESWLFLPAKVPLTEGSQADVSPDSETSARTGIDHVVDWSELQHFLAARATVPTVLYFAADPFAVGDLPANITGDQKQRLPLWVATIVQKWPTLRPVEIADRLRNLMAVESTDELGASRAAARATIPAFFAGLHAIRPGVSQRRVEAAVENACWEAGAHGSSFWPWAMTGANAVFPRPYWSISRYDHLDATLRAGDLVRLDVGCEWNHYAGDLGRTVPASGKFTDEQREIWDMLVDAYRAATKTFRPGTTPEQVYDAWRAELIHHRATVKTARARRAIELWSVRKNVPYFYLHTTNLDAAFVEGALRTGMVIDFEPIVSIDELGFYLEDMFLITKDSAEDLTPGVPFTADEIESAMRPR